MGNKGWIKLHRSIQECTLWDDKPFDKARAWIDLLLLANHEDKRIMFNGYPITIVRGQYLTSVRKLAERWGWSCDKVSRYLTVLVNEEMVLKDSNNNRTLLTIVNYGVYQSDSTPTSTVTSTQTEHSQVHSPNADRTLTSTRTSDKQEYKELKNEKNEKNNIRSVYFPNDEILDSTFAEYVLMRKKIKKPFATDHAVELAMKKLMRLANDDNDLAIEILNQSIENSWQGLFEIRNRNTGGIDWSKV